MSRTGRTFRRRDVCFRAPQGQARPRGRRVQASGTQAAHATKGNQELNAPGQRRQPVGLDAPRELLNRRPELWQSVGAWASSPSVPGSI